MTKSIHGIAASSGIAFGKAYKLIVPDLTFEKQTINNNEAEINRFFEATAQTKRELTHIRNKVAHEQREEHAAIFDAHILMLNDPEFITAVKEKINNERVNAESALHDVTSFFIGLFEQLENEYMCERAADIKDVTNRILSHLLGTTLPDLSLITEKSIIIADDLSPSDAAQINKQFVKGFVTNSGGRTSHAAILARSMDIPAIVGTKDISSTIKHNDYLIIDGLTGTIFINPTDHTRKKCIDKETHFQKEKTKWALLKDKPTVSIDHRQVELVANIGFPHDVDAVLHNGAEGIGLYRTEFLYMKRTSLPTEDELFEAYKTVLHKMNDKPVVVRTLDIGGDKQLPYRKLPEEANPFLGLRAVRFALQEGDIFRTQLRALLRASTYGHLKIMFPMIATLDEFREAKDVLLEEKQKLLHDGIPTNGNIEVGIMVEIPSTAILADKFAKEVDFFSIGTNDLIQYTFAADRMNENVAYLYQPYHPAILRLVKFVIDAAQKEGKWTGMCGEMAGDQHAIPLLLGLGLDEFSMDPSSILQSRNLIKQLNQKNMSDLAKRALELRTAKEVKELVDSTLF